jgi:O-antigen biosynthesis protein WbqV
MLPSAFEADASPESVLTRAQAGLTVSRLPSLEGSGEAAPAPVAVEDLLLRPSEDRLSAARKFREGQIGCRHRWRRIDRIGDLRPRVTFGASRLLIVENAGARAACGSRKSAVKFPAAAVEGRIADIRDRSRIMHLMAEFSRTSSFTPRR